MTFGNRVWRLEFGPNMPTLMVLAFAVMYLLLTKRAFDRTGQWPLCLDGGKGVEEAGRHSPIIH